MVFYDAKRDKKDLDELIDELKIPYALGGLVSAANFIGEIYLVNKINIGISSINAKEISSLIQIIKDYSVNIPNLF